MTGPAPSRIAIEGVVPEVDGGRFPVKRVRGDRVRVEASVFADGPDAVRAALRWRRDPDGCWEETPMASLGNDRWRGSFPVDEPGFYRYTIEGWTDPFLTWRGDLLKRLDAGQEVLVDLAIGAALVREAAGRARDEDRARLAELAGRLEAGDRDAVSDDSLVAAMERYGDPARRARYERELRVRVDRERARFSTWYEMFPRSCASEPGRHGTFRDCEARLPYLARLGFDVLYFPPIHPIGRSFRKGPNNSLTAGPDDPGSPWAIGAAEGGHDAIHPALGTEADFVRLLERASDHGIEVALDLAFQCSVDHPWVEQHPEWFVRRPDGTIQYAENPPKKYQDIYPLNFAGPDWRGLWEALKGVVLHWAGLGVRIFRVDNPHTKPFPFWEWLIGEVQALHPETIFLSEAFTRPRVMYRLAKLGFTQSYTYFTWRNTAAELTQYFTELTQSEVREFFRPNLWPNTPDILHEFLQTGGRPAFQIRLALAATLGANYGIYGPAFELLERVPLVPGSEEYRNSEKYQLRQWDLGDPESLAEVIARINRVRREHPALQQDWNLRFHRADNPHLLSYTKSAGEGDDAILTIVSLDPREPRSGAIELDREDGEGRDLLSGERFRWRAGRLAVALTPERPVLIIDRSDRSRRPAPPPPEVPAEPSSRGKRTERDFDYYA